MRGHRGDAGPRSATGRVKGVIVAGCLAERQKDQLLDAVSGRRPGGRRLRPRADRRGLRPHPGRPARAADPVPSRPGRRPGRPRPAPDHAAAPGVPQGLGRVRPQLHVLRDPLHARKARHQADRAGRRRGPRAGPRRRPRADAGRPGHDLLRRRSVRPAPARRTASTSSTRSRELDWIRILYSYPQLLH